MRQLHWPKPNLALEKEKEIVVIKLQCFLKDGGGIFVMKQFLLKTLEIRCGEMLSGEGLHSSETKLTGTWCWVFLPSTNSMQSGPLKLALLTDYALEDCVSSHPVLLPWIWVWEPLIRHIQVIRCTCIWALIFLFSFDLWFIPLLFFPWQIHIRTKHFIFWKYKWKVSNRMWGIYTANSWHFNELCGLIPALSTSGQSSPLRAMTGS